MISFFSKIVLLLYFTTGFCQQNSKDNFKKLFINEEKYSIMFPLNWVLENPDSTKNSFSLIKQNSSTNSEVISLHINDLRQSNVKIKAVEKIIEKRLKFAVEILSNKTVKKYNLTAKEYIYKSFSEGKLTTFLEYFFIKESDLYILLYGCNSETYFQNISEAQKIIETFEIK